MKQIFVAPLPILDFPIPWSAVLATHLGSIAFRIKHPSFVPIPSEWLGLVSSHDSKHGYASLDWQESLLSAMQLANRQGWGILCARDVPYAEIIIHACKRLQVPYRLVFTTRSPENEHDRRPASDAENALDFSTLALLCDESSTNENIPIHDIASVFLANHLFVLELKEGGKIARLLDARLRCKEIPPGSTFLSLARNRTVKTTRPEKSDWLDRGAVGWLNTRSREPLTSPIPLVSAEPFFGRTYQPIFSIRMLNNTESKYLVHCTRSRRGPWPDQSITQFHDEVLQNPWKEQPSVFETLQRILRLQRIIATNRFRRGKTETVCFSNNDIMSLLSMRKFQTHLARWDWEPYGIMIDREWLERHGAKKVSYIDRATAKQTIDEALTYCQVMADDAGSRDWRTEREWRIAGDVRLSQVPFSKALIFVPTLAEARLLQPISRWPIVIANLALSFNRSPR